MNKVWLGLAVGVMACGLGVSAQEARMSPHETASVTLAGKQITITYGRPSIRGRKIMGGVVPYGRVWRTGADEATTLETPVDLNIGGTDLSAGKYTLWTLPSSDKWKLIINKETGQWGTNYHEAQDLARVDMQQSHIAQPVDEFTISFNKKSENSADLVLEWENTRVIVPVRAK